MTTTATETRSPKNVRVPDELWDAAKKRATGEGTNVAEVIRRALEAYVADGEPETVSNVTIRVTVRGSRVVTIEPA